MTETVPEVFTKERVSSYLYIASVYFVGVGALYLWGYWNTFNVNILQYMDLADILKSTLYPIASTLIAMGVGVLLGELQSGPRLPSGGGKNTPVGRLLNKYRVPFEVCYLLMIVAIIGFGNVYKWHVAGPLISAPAVLFAKERGVLASLLPNDSVRTCVLFVLVCFPFVTYGNGQVDASAVLGGTKYWYVASKTIADLPNDPTDPKKQIKHLGQVSGYLFLLLPDNSTLAIIPVDKVNGLQLRHFKK